MALQKSRFIKFSPRLWHFEKLTETYEELAVCVKVPRRLYLLKVGSRDPDVEEGQFAIRDDSLQRNYRKIRMKDMDAASGTFVFGD
jgi:hypothetical protein